MAAVVAVGAVVADKGVWGVEATYGGVAVPWCASLLAVVFDIVAIGAPVMMLKPLLLLLLAIRVPRDDAWCCCGCCVNAPLLLALVVVPPKVDSERESLAEERTEEAEGGRLAAAIIGSRWYGIGSPLMGL